eukprot:g3361.t1
MSARLHQTVVRCSADTGSSSDRAPTSTTASAEDLHASVNDLIRNFVQGRSDFEEGGKNAAILSYGARGTGKTRCLFDEEVGVVPTLLEQACSCGSGQFYCTLIAFSADDRVWDLFQTEPALLSSRGYHSDFSQSARRLPLGGPCGPGGHAGHQHANKSAMMDTLKDALRLRIGGAKKGACSSKGSSSSVHLGGHHVVFSLHRKAAIGEGVQAEGNHLADGCAMSPASSASRFPSALDERSFISSRRYVPYRNSRLTQFLRPVLSGDERLQLRSLWILCVSPRPEDRLDSEETLRFGELLRSIPRVAASRGSTLTGARRSVELFSQTKLKPRLPTGIFPKGPIGSVVERVVAAPVEASGPGAIEEANVAIGCRLKRPRSFSTGQIAIEFNTSEADCNPDGKHGGEEDEEEPGPTTRKRRSLSSSCVEYEMCGYETCGDCGTKDSAALEGIRTMDPTDTSGSLGAFPEWPLLHRETKTVYYSMAANVKILPRTPLTGVSSCPSTNAKNFCMSSDLEDSVEDDDENGVADVYENGFDVLNARAKQDQAMQATQQRRDKTTGSRLTEMACTSTPPSSSSDESDGFRARLSQLAAEIEKIDVRRDLEGGADANGGEESKKSERLRMPETSSGLEEASMPNIDKDEGEEEDGQIRYPEYFAIGTPRGHRGIATERAYDGKGRFGDAEFGCGGPVFSPETKPPVDAFRTPAYRRSVPDSAATLSYGYLDEDTSFDHPDHSPHRQSKVPLEDFWAKTNPSDCSLSPACPAEDVQGQEEQFHICPTDDHRFAPMHVRRQELALLEEAERAANTDDDTLFEPLYHADVDSYSFMQSDSQLMFPTDFTGLLARGAAEGVEVASNGRQEFFSPRSVKIPAKTNFRGDLLVVSNREEDGAFWKHHLQTVGGDPGVVGSRARFRGDLAVSQDKSDTLWERHFRTLPGPRVDGVEEQGMTKVSYPEESLLYRSSPSEYPVSSGDDFCHCSPGIQKTSTGSSIPVAGRWTTRGGSGGSKKSRASPYSKATSGAVAASVPMPPRTPVADVFVKHAHQTVSSYHDFAPSCSSGASTRAPDSGDSHHLVTRQKAEKRDGSCASPLSDLGGCGKFVLDESPLMELSAAGGEGDPVSDHGGAEAAAWLSPTPKAGNAATSSFALLGDISPLSLPNDSTPEKFDHSTPEKVDSLVRPGGGSVGGGSDEVVKRSLSPLLGEVEEAAEGVLLTAPDDKERQEHEQDAKVAAREVHYVPLFSLETALTEVSPVLLNFERPRKMKQEHPLSPILEDDLSACSEDEEQGEKQVGDFIERENACDHAAILEESRCTVSMPGSPGQRTDDGVDLDSASDWCKTPTEKNRNKISPRRTVLLQNTARIEKCGKCNKFFQYDVLLPNGRTPIRCTICGEACDSPGPPSGTGSDLRSSDRLRLPSFADLLPKQ